MLTLPQRRNIKGPLQRVAIATVAAGTLAILMGLQKHAGGSVLSATVIKVPVVAQVTYGVPARLKIPKINLDAPVGQMGVMPDGSMQAPSGAHDTGWFKFGPHPGEPGSAVIAGHYGRWKNGEGSVFDDLNKLKVGDSIFVQDKAGGNVAFVVHGSHMYSRDQVAAEVFSSADGKSHLNLVTCQGNWDENLKTYSGRLVVFADRQ